MNTRQMEYFVAIAEERQVTAAAARLHISQPPLSRELARMERELGVRLVVRGPRSVELTEAGKLLYRRCREVLELTGAMEREVESFGSGGSGVVSLGLVSSSGRPCRPTPWPPSWTTTPTCALTCTRETPSRS